MTSKGSRIVSDDSSLDWAKFTESNQEQFCNGRRIVILTMYSMAQQLRAMAQNVTSSTAKCSILSTPSSLFYYCATVLNTPELVWHVPKPDTDTHKSYGLPCTDKNWEFIAELASPLQVPFITTLIFRLNCRYILIKNFICWKICNIIMCYPWIMVMIIRWSRYDGIAENVKYRFLFLVVLNLG